MRRRRIDTNTVSLFSFQDIMASVIGILFFCVLLMALDIVNQAPRAASSEDDPETRLMEKVRTAKAALAEFAKHTDGLAQRLDRLSQTDPEALRKRVQQLQAKLSAKYAALQAAGDTANGAARQAQQRRAELEEKQKELDDLEKRLAAAKAQLDAPGSGPKLSFIIDDREDRLEPWLVEVTATAFRVAERNPRGTFMEFRSKTDNQRLDLFRSWLQTQDNSERYIVILVKPSGAAIAHSLERELPTLGFQIGVELLPEDWIPF